VTELYDPAQRGELAALMERVWGERPQEDELAWWHEAPGTTTLVVADGERLAGAVTMSLVRMLLDGDETLVGVATRLATDPAHRGRGVFGGLQRASEERAEVAGARLLLVVPNAASTPIFLERLGWTALAPLRLRVRLLPGRRAQQVPELRPLPPREGGLIRDEAYLRWRFGGPRGYRLYQDGRGYLAVGRRGRASFVAATAGDPPLPAAALALPPTRGLPLPKTFAVLGRSLGVPLPRRLALELGDLDFL
jgi:predicted N-acetyltransferase YhbS